MQDLVPYLMFDGNCEEAMHFYKEVFDGEIPYMGRFGDGQMENVPESAKNWVMHSSLKFWGGSIMASDTLPGNPLASDGTGARVHLSLNFEDTGKLESTFGRLKAGGNVAMELQDTFWGDRFGMITDRFGISWMLSCPVKQVAEQG
ncbi:MAG: VOC family protein [Lewinellaceae bacterium]|nr:VOC family protein [Lewinellaceae bacterium]